MPNRTESSPLVQPATADLVIGFVNTRANTAGYRERLGDADGLRAWMDRGGLNDPTAHVTDADSATARELRDALLSLLLVHSGDLDPDAERLRDAERHLGDLAERYPLVSVVGAGGVALRPAQGGVPGVFGSLLAALTELAQTGAWQRIKACRDLTCHLAFFDRTRNGSAVYCSPNCGSRSSMRAYRQRKSRPIA
ncbi:hypothetical protein GCM10023322_76320 [Rugosimonospora acidiphila]|uniref:Zinc finger CGNR domain-containing protein n=1 Tax=Rugosimonospora acidiphila TaxID=556531 RepID=A0ABP9SQY9_9ACTN